jgi:hypothetical protein
LLAADRKKRHNFCEKKKPQKLRPFLRQLKQALARGQRVNVESFVR